MTDRRAFACMVAAFISAFVVRWPAVGRSAEETKEVKCSRLVVVDKLGRERFVVEEQDEGHMVAKLVGIGGGEVGLGAHKDGSANIVVARKDSARISIWTSPESKDGPGILIYGANGTSMINMLLRGGEMKPELSMRDESGKSATWKP